MRRFKHAVALLLTVVLLGSLPTAFAYETNTISIPMIAQQGEMWCWASCTQACIRYYLPNNTTTQSEIVFAIYGNTSTSNGGNAYTIQNALLLSALSGSASYVSPISYLDVKADIDSSRPIVIGVSKDSWSHAIVGTGYLAADNGTYSVAYMDPLTGNVAATNAGSNINNVIFYLRSDGVKAYAIYKVSGIHLIP